MDVKSTLFQRFVPADSFVCTFIAVKDYSFSKTSIFLTADVCAVYRFLYVRITCDHWASS